MGGLTPFDWPAQAVRFSGDGFALALLALPVGSTRALAGQHARLALRQILGALLARPADEIVLRESGTGPVLENAARDIRISLSYASGRCLIGLAEGHPLGVDIVRIEQLPEIEALSRLYLTIAAHRDVIEAPPAARAARFALAWAQMEARSKCLGLPLAEIDAPRGKALQACELLACHQPADYRIALASQGLSAEHAVISI